MTVGLIRELPGDIGANPENPLLPSKFAIPDALPSGWRGPASSPGSRRAETSRSRWSPGRPAAARLSWSRPGRRAGRRASRSPGHLGERGRPGVDLLDYLIEALRRAEPVVSRVRPLVPSDTVDRSVLGRLAAALVRPAAADRAGARRRLAAGRPAVGGRPGVRAAPRGPAAAPRAGGPLGSAVAAAPVPAGRRAHRDPQRRPRVHRRGGGEPARAAPRRARRSGLAGAAGAHRGLGGRAAAVRERPAGPHGPGRGGRHHLGRRHDLRRVFRRRGAAGPAAGGTPLPARDQRARHLTPELAEAVTQRTDARRILATLTRENAFVQPSAPAPAGTATTGSSASCCARN